MKTKEYQAPNCRVIFMPAIKLLMGSPNIQDTSSGFVGGFSEDEEDVEGN